MKLEHRDDALSIGKGLTRWHPMPGGWDHGEHLSQHGIVTIVRDQGGKHPMLRLDFVREGRLHIRSWRASVSRLSAARRASKFAREVIEEAA